MADIVDRLEAIKRSTRDGEIYHAADLALHEIKRMRAELRKTTGARDDALDQCIARVEKYGAELPQYAMVCAWIAESLRTIRARP